MVVEGSAEVALDGQKAEYLLKLGGGSRTLSRGEISLATNVCRIQAGEVGTKLDHTVFEQSRLEMVEGFCRFLLIELPAIPRQ